MSAVSEPKLYISIPYDSKTWYGLYSVDYIIEAQEDSGNLNVLAPEEFAKDHLKVSKSSFKEYPFEGPARKLTHDEYVPLYHKIDPDLPLPSGYEKCKAIGADTLPRKEKDNCSIQ